MANNFSGEVAKFLTMVLHPNKEINAVILMLLFLTLGRPQKLLVPMDRLESLKNLPPLPSSLAKMYWENGTLGTFLIGKSLIIIGNPD